MSFDFHKTYAHLCAQPIKVDCPSKVNLRLKVQGVRSDGYHFLSMLNASTDLADRIFVQFKAQGPIELFVGNNFMGDLLTLEKRAEISHRLSNLETNLAARAASAFFRKFEIPFGVVLDLHKDIPLGSGLGGGSSDAGTLLRWLANTFKEYLTKVHGLEWSSLRSELIKIAASIGADVPYFIEGGLAAVKGIGDEVDPLYPRILENFPVLLVIPNDEISTQKVYDHLRASAKVPALAQPLPDPALDSFVSAFKDFLASVDSESEAGLLLTDQLKLLRDQMKDLIENDLEQAVCNQAPIVAEILGRVRKIPNVIASVSGSGGSVLLVPKLKNYLEISLTNELTKALQGLPLTIRATLLCPRA